MQREPEQHRNQEEEIIDLVRQNLSRDDLYHIAYLKPFQCKLDKPNAQNLPIGLRIINRTSENQYQKVPGKEMTAVMSNQKFNQLLEQGSTNPGFQRLSSEEKKLYNEVKDMKYLEYMKMNNIDNMLCQMKAQGDIQMAICICMYNEDRGMLEHTLAGVGENIVKLAQQGVDPDKIVVVIISDGIEKVNPDIIPLFEIFEMESGMNFGDEDYKDSAQIIRKIKRDKEHIKNYDISMEGNLIDKNVFLFGQDEAAERRRLRFVNVKQEYDMVKKLQKDIIELKSRKNVTHDDLPLDALKNFKKECKAYKLGQFGNNEEKGDEKSDEKYFQAVKDNNTICKPLVQKALTKTLEYCRQYINNRADLSHVSFFRTAQFFNDIELEKVQGPNQEILNTSTDSANGLNLAEKTMSESWIDWTEEEKLKRLQSKIRADANKMKMNIFFCVKYGNNQKLNSHSWFFNGFCKELSNCELREADNKKRPFIETTSPKYTILLDVGLRPGPDALVKMYNAMNNEPSVGGVCGYMGLKLEKVEDHEAISSQSIDFITNLTLFFVDIQRAQQLQYHFAHLIDKGFESIFRFIHVLPGAFSGYSMNAIWGNDFNQYCLSRSMNPLNLTQQEKNNTIKEYLQQQGDTDALLKNYFKSISQKVKNNDLGELNLSFLNIMGRILLPNRFMNWLTEPALKENEKKSTQSDTIESLMYNSNVYLAQDRILCLGIYKNKKKLLFLPDAYSFVDPVKDLPTLLGQRKRWINGSYFAFEKVSAQLAQEGFCQRSLLLALQIEYLGFMNLLAWLAPGFFIFTVSVAMEAFRADVLSKVFENSLTADSEIYSIIVYTINFIYALLILGLIYYSMNLTNKSKDLVRFVYTLSTFLGVMSLIIISILVVDLARGLGQSSSYLISNQDDTFVDSIPGGQDTVDLLRYIVIGIMGLYALPVIFYSIVFCNFRVIPEVIGGVLSFIFYTPTYLIILSIYALCRMDDLSWGTKGLDGGKGGQNKDVLDCWKIIKTIHVGKLIFWNVVVGGLLIHFGSNYLVRFYLTFAIMVLIGSTMAVKVVLSMMYYLIYRCSCWTKTSPKDENSNRSSANMKMSLGNNFQGGHSLLRDMNNALHENTQAVNPVHKEIMSSLSKFINTGKKQKNRLLSPLPEKHYEKARNLQRTPPKKQTERKAEESFGGTDVKSTQKLVMQQESFQAIKPPNPKKEKGSGSKFKKPNNF